MLEISFFPSDLRLWIYCFCPNSDSLREAMDFDLSAIYELQLAIYVFQEAVRDAPKNYYIIILAWFFMFVA